MGEDNAALQAEEIYCYVGPSLKAIPQSIQNGSIFNNTKADLLLRFNSLISRFPEIAELIVSPEEILTAKAEIRRGEGHYHHAYEAVVKAADAAELI